MSAAVSHDPASTKTDTVSPANSPPTYTTKTSSPDLEEKIAYQGVSDEKAPVTGDEKKPIVYESYPEVVEQQAHEKKEDIKNAPADNQNLPMDSRTPPPLGEHQWSQDRQQWNQTPMTPPPQTYTPPVQHQDSYNRQSMVPYVPGPGAAAPPERSWSDPSLPDTVTPLHLLGEQPDYIDCPFCRRRSETVIKKLPSRKTHINATILFFTTVVGAAAPYAGKWKSNIAHHCKNCDRKVAFLKYGSKEVEVFGTPDHLRERSKFPEAPQPAPAPAPAPEAKN